MYKNPQLSSAAKVLKAELAARGLEVALSQAMEICARIAGDRTLHVAQAKKNAPVSVDSLVLAQASALMFTTLGRYKGNVRGLMASIRAGFALQDQGSRAVEAAMGKIFDTANAPKVSPLYEYSQLEALPDVFDSLLKCLEDSLCEEARAPASEPRENVVYEALAYDWRAVEGEDLAELPAHQQGGYDVKLSTHIGQQLTLDITPAGVDLLNEPKGKHPQMTLFVEINKGIPCVHISNDVFGDMVLSVFSTKDGLYLRPESNNDRICTGKPSPEGLKQLEADLYQDSPAGRELDAFIKT